MYLFIHLCLLFNFYLNFLYYFYIDLSPMSLFQLSCFNSELCHLIPRLTLPLQAYGGCETHAKCESAHLKPAFGFSILHYCRNMKVQHGDLCKRGPAPSIDKKSSFESNEKTKTLIFR